MKTRLMILLMGGLLVFAMGNLLAEEGVATKEGEKKLERLEVDLPSPTGPELDVVTAESIDLTTPSGKKLNKAIGKVEAAADEKGMSEDDSKDAVSALKDLVDKGVPVKHALKVVETAITLQDYDGEEVAEIARSLGDCVEESGVGKECARIAQAGIEKGLRAKEIARVMSTVENALGKDASARQLRIMTQDLLDKGSGVEGLEVAIEAVGKSVEEGYSPEESRKSVALIALKGLRDGLRGKELANAIRKEAQRGLVERGGVEREIARERAQERIREEVKDRLKEEEWKKERQGEDYEP